MPGSEFQWLAVVFGMLTGLGVTRLLSSCAAALRSRAVSKIDWLPMIWSASIFLCQLDYWWVLHDLKETVQEWTYPEFLQLLISPLALFFAAALILPSSELKAGETHREIFDSHGHWALMALSLYHIEGLLEAAKFWKSNILSLAGVVVVVFAILPVAGFFSGRRLHLVIASLYLALSITFVFFNIGNLL